VRVSELEDLTRQDLIRLVLKQHETILGQEETIRRLGDEVAALEAQVEDLKSKLSGGGSSAPEWVKANRATRPKRDRKKRKQSFARRREPPTEVYQHALDRCPDCGRKLSGGWLHRRRQVIEIPLTPVRIVEHQVMAGYCGVCHKVYVPSIDLSGEVVGRHRVGINLMSLVAHLAIDGRMPLRAIQTLLGVLYRLHLARGELAQILHTVAKLGQGEYEKLRENVRASPAVAADETGWREDGINGYCGASAVLGAFPAGSREVGGGAFRARGRSAVGSQGAERLPAGQAIQKRCAEGTNTSQDALRARVAGVGCTISGRQRASAATCSSDREVHLRDVGVRPEPRGAF